MLHPSLPLRGACIFFKKTYSLKSGPACLPHKRAKRCCCGGFVTNSNMLLKFFAVANRPALKGLS